MRHQGDKKIENYGDKFKVGGMLLYEMPNLSIFICWFLQFFHPMLEASLLY